jgi:dihydrofolate reductase
MRLALNMFMSLDGVVQSGGGPEEDPRGGFKYGGWQAPFADEEMGRWVMDFIANADAFLIGRWTYELFAAYWPTGPEPFAAMMNTTPKYVVSKSLERVDWNNSTLIRGDLATEVARLKAMPGRDLQIYGATLAASLAKLNLIDEYLVWLNPVLLGSGKRLFDADGPAMTLRLTESRTTSTGVTVNRYVPAGEVKTGSMDNR